MFAGKSGLVQLPMMIGREVTSPNITVKTMKTVLKRRVLNNPLMTKPLSAWTMRKNLASGIIS